MDRMGVAMMDRILACPVCGGHLKSDGKTLECKKGHTFDWAAKGYANLLLSQDKSSKNPGDSKEMVKARRRFFEEGYYSPLASALAGAVLEQLRGMARDPLVILDAGCGEGYYTRMVGESLRQAGLQASMLGMDISREAIRLAAGYKEARFFVASLFKLPLADNSVDLIINCFAPACDREFSRVLKPNGRLITVFPGREHLFSLKSILYDNPYENDEKGPELPSFQVLETKKVTHAITIEGNERVLDLLAMTPYFWRTPEAGINRLKAVETLTTTIDFIIQVSGLK